MRNDGFYRVTVRQEWNGLTQSYRDRFCFTVLVTKRLDDAMYWFRKFDENISMEYDMIITLWGQNGNRLREWRTGDPINKEAW